MLDFRKFANRSTHKISGGLAVNNFNKNGIIGVERFSFVKKSKTKHFTYNKILLQSNLEVMESRSMRARGLKRKHVTLPKKRHSRIPPKCNSSVFR